MPSIRDVAFALDPPTPSWSLKTSLDTGIWPPLENSTGISLKELCRRFAPAGAALRKMDTGEGTVWQHIGRGTVVAQLRDRIRDPAIIRQATTNFCGPVPIVLELARRSPERYVNWAAELLAKGKLTPFPANGDVDVIVAEADLRQRPVPISEVDWLFAATMRDHENIMDDVDDGAGFEGLTAPGAMEHWTKCVLNLNANSVACWHYGELDALSHAQSAIEAGGVAFLLIDKQLLPFGEEETKEAKDDEEEDMHWRLSVTHEARTVPREASSAWIHSEDDSGIWPDHWVLYLGGLSPANPSENDQIKLRVWSWGYEFEVSGSAGAFGEYLWQVVTGTP